MTPGINVVFSMEENGGGWEAVDAAVQRVLPGPPALQVVGRPAATQISRQCQNQGIQVRVRGSRSESRELGQDQGIQVRVRGIQVRVRGIQVRIRGIQVRIRGSGSESGDPGQNQGIQVKIRGSRSESGGPGQNQGIQVKIRGSPGQNQGIKVTKQRLGEDWYELTGLSFCSNVGTFLLVQWALALEIAKPLSVS